MENASLPPSPEPRRRAITLGGLGTDGLPAGRTHLPKRGGQNAETEQSGSAVALNKTSPLLEKTATQDTNGNVNGVLLMTSRLPKHLTAAVRIRHTDLCFSQVYNQYAIKEGVAPFCVKVVHRNRRKTIREPDDRLKKKVSIVCHDLVS